MPTHTSRQRPRVCPACGTLFIAIGRLVLARLARRAHAGRYQSLSCVKFIQHVISFAINVVCTCHVYLVGIPAEAEAAETEAAEAAEVCPTARSPRRMTLADTFGIVQMHYASQPGVGAAHDALHPTATRWSCLQYKLAEHSTKITNPETSISVNNIHCPCGALTQIYRPLARHSTCAMGEPYSTTPHMYLPDHHVRQKMI